MKWVTKNSTKLICKIVEKETNDVSCVPNDEKMTFQEQDGHCENQTGGQDNDEGNETRGKDVNQRSRSNNNRTNHHTKEESKQEIS